MRYLMIILLLSVLGCGRLESSRVGKIAQDTTAAPAAEIAGWDSDSEKQIVESSERANSGKSSQGSEPLARRKIIYSATMDVVVEQFDSVEPQINGLVNSHGGFIAKANIGKLQGKRRRGYWVARIPVDQYESFLNAVGNIGVPASRNQSASDVTEEFVDLEARVANKRKLEARIIELLERPDDKIQHVIEVERELARVREDIERMEGRLRFLKDQTSLTTVTINVREEQDYVPPQAPTFANRVSSAWSSSLANCQRFFENLVVAAAGNAIGFGIFLVGLLIAIPLIRLAVRWLRKWIGSIASPETSHQS